MPLARKRYGLFLKITYFSSLNSKRKEGEPLSNIKNLILPFIMYLQYFSILISIDLGDGHILVNFPTKDLFVNDRVV